MASATDSLPTVADMYSVRVRIAVIAAAITAIALAVAGVFLLMQLRSSLAAEVDGSLERQVVNFAVEVESFDDFSQVAWPADLDTLLMVLDPSGFVTLDNDQAVDGSEVAAQLELADAALNLDGDVRFADLSLTTPVETLGADNLRAAYYELFLADQEPDEVFFVVVARSTDASDRTVSTVRNTLLAGIPAVVLFVAALAWWLTGRSLKPVDLMRRQVDDITSDDLARRVSEPRAQDEIGELATTMNRMLGRLEAAQRSQEQFVSDAAHELRTPLASIAAQLDVDKAHPDTADRASTATNVRYEVSRLQDLIDDLLASARNQNTAEKAPPHLVDLDVVAAEAASRITAPPGTSVQQSGIGAGTVRGDHAALARLAENLLANAVRHAAGNVAIGVGVDQAGAWLTVDDDGSGIAVADRERVFDRFVRLDGARSRDAGGTGLGLALARETAHRHGGSLRVEDSPLGGARFVLQLPAA